MTMKKKTKPQRKPLTDPVSRAAYRKAVAESLRKAFAPWHPPEHRIKALKLAEIDADYRARRAMHFAANAAADKKAAALRAADKAMAVAKKATGAVWDALLEAAADEPRG
jgi:hypothetical protein